MASQAQTAKFQDPNATRIRARMAVLASTTTSDLTLVIVRMDGLVPIASKWWIGAAIPLAKTEPDANNEALDLNANAKLDGLASFAMSDKFLAKRPPS